MPIVIPTIVDFGVEGLVLDGLDLAQGPNGSAIQLDAFTPPFAKKRPEWIEAADSDGAILARDPLVSNGQAVIKLAVGASDRDAVHIIIGTLIDKLEEADRNPGGIPLVWTPSLSTTSLTFYVLSGEVTDLPVDWESGYMAFQPSLTITLDCAPYGHGAPITITGSATAGPLVTLDLPDVPGDVPALGTLRITESSSQPRRTVEFGAEYRYYNPASPWSLVLDSDSLVTSGFAGTQTTLTGAYDPGAAGNSIIVSTVATSPQAICGTGAQPHIGTFRVKMRMNSGPGGCTEVRIRFAWRAGDGSYTSNDPIIVTSTVENEFLERDLGLITIPEANAGTQSWDGRVEAWRLSDSDTIYVDYLMLIPTEGGYGKATASYAHSPGVIAARDGFTGLGFSVALSGRTPDAGAAWVTAGVATDFVGDTVVSTFTQQPRVRRFTGVVEATPRIGVLGDAMTNQRVEATFYQSAVAEIYAGVVARYVDTSNYLRLRVSRGLCEIVKVVAGVETVIASATRESDLRNPNVFELTAFASGRVTARMAAASGSVWLTLDASDSAIATGGALASGKGGIADQSNSTTAVSRRYDDVVVSTPPAEPLVMHNNRKFEVRHDSAERESNSGGTWGRPQSYRGSRFYVQPAGDQDRTTRVAVKASRNDLASAADDNLSDTITLEAVITPRYSVVPRS